MTEAKASKAAKADVQDSPHVYRFKGEKFSFPADKKLIQVEAIESFEDGKPVGFLRGIMGDQWARYKALNPTLGDFEDFASTMAQAYGFQSVPESSASDDS